MMAKVIPIMLSPGKPSANKKGTIAGGSKGGKEDDDDSVASSSLNSVPNEYEEEEEPNSESAFIKKRNELKTKILQEVMSEVMPDMGAYDIDGMVRSRSVRKGGPWTKFLKAVGIKELDLFEAVFSGQLYQVQRTVRTILYGKKPNPKLMNQYNEDGVTPLSVAVKSNLTSIAQYMLSNKALPDICDESSGCTPLMYSVLHGNYLISSALLSNGAAVDLGDYKCVTPLMLAASRNDLRHCQMMCRNFADVDLQDQNGWTPLHYCAYANATDCMLFLLGEAASRTVKDLHRRKPIDIAKFLNNGECIAILSEFKY